MGNRGALLFIAGLSRLRRALQHKSISRALRADGPLNASFAGELHLDEQVGGMKRMKMGLRRVSPVVHVDQLIRVSC